ncbi:MAG: hypothetical protein ACREBG_03020 [Pyrinomonadaceae bacterium]
MSGKSSRNGGLRGSSVGRGGVGEAIGICMPGVITCPGPGDGDAVGICMPGVITCPGLGDGDAVGICISGVITCPGLGDGEGLGLVRRARVDVLFFLGVLIALGLAAGFIFDMSCCSC